MRTIEFDNPSSNQTQLQTEVEQTFLVRDAFKILYRRLLQKTNKFIVAVKYVCYKWTIGSFKGGKIPYFKIAVVCFVVFLCTQRNLYFQFRLQAPQNTGQQSEVVEHAQRSSKSTKTEQLSLAPSFGWNGKEQPTLALNFSQQDVEAYIKRFMKVAIAEHKKYGIPASIKIAQGILATQAGTIDGLSGHNNHFGVVMEGRTYESAWENWRLHSLYLTNEKSKFKSLVAKGDKYKAWAKGLQKLDYSHYENYSKLLIQVIEQYKIYQLDKMYKKNS